MIPKQTHINFCTKELEPPKKGRNAGLVSARDRLLVARYYYWTEIKRRRFDDTLEILQDKEVFISEKRIEAILREQDEYLVELITYKTSANELRKQFPSFNWN